MSSTITVGKHVRAFRASDIAVYYALFEKTYESNVHPHDPDWSCIYFGGIDGAITRVFDHASSCSGGMLRGPGTAEMKPENYIAHWLRLMKAPYALPDCSVKLETGKSYRYAFSDQTRGEGAAVFAAAGFDDLSSCIEAGAPVSLSLYDYAALLARLAAGLVTVWKMIEPPFRIENGVTAPNLGYNPKPARFFALPEIDVYKVGEYDHIVRNEAGQWKPAGWAYEMVGNYVKSRAPLERQLPGSYKACIEAYRQAVEAAKPLPPGATATIAPPKGKKWDWTSSSSLAFKEKYESGQPFTLTAETAIENNVFYVPPECVTWNIPEAAVLAA